ncbi:unnamed protein product [Cochlearia groenlandica]
MKRPIPSNSPFVPNASFKASRIRTKPVVPSSDNLVSPHRRATSKDKIEEVPSLETVLKMFWDNQREQLQYFSTFNRQTNLPLSRLRRILKSDPEVKMISWDTPAVFSKACEYLILELTLRAWNHTQSCSRKTIHSCDIFMAARKSKVFGFITDLDPYEPDCPIHQSVAVATSCEMMLPDMNVPIDMEEINEEENLISERFIGNDKGFDLNCDAHDCTCDFGFCNEHGSDQKLLI